MGTPETVPVSWHGVLHFVCGGIGFVALAATGGAAWALLGFTAAVIVASAWLSLVFLRIEGN